MPLPEASAEASTVRSRSDNALAWAQLGVCALSIAVGAIIGLTGHPALGAAIASAGSATLSINIHRR